MAASRGRAAISAGAGPGWQQATTGVILFMSSQDDEGRLPVVELKMNAIDELRKLLEEGDVDLLRTLVKQVV